MSSSRQPSPFIRARSRIDATFDDRSLFGLLNMALSDRYVATFDTKYHAYNYWRPVAAIQNAATDGNPTPRPTRRGPPW